MAHPVDGQLMMEIQYLLRIIMAEYSILVVRIFQGVFQITKSVIQSNNKTMKLLKQIDPYARIVIVG